MKILYIDCFSGISGDMTLAALIDLGVPLKAIREEVAKLGLSGVEISAKRGMCQGIAGTRCTVTAPGPSGHLAEGVVVALDAAMPTIAKGSLIASKAKPGGSLLRLGGDDHEHRPYAAIRSLLDSVPLKPRIRAQAQAIFRKLAEAEAHVHGTDVETISFHEVGSADAIADIVGVCAGLAWLGVEAIHCAPLPIARGFVDCAHGRMPLPAPAVAQLIRGVPVVPDPRHGEWVTPTGAAIAVALASGFGDAPPMTPDTIGYGLGKRDGGPIPNALRLILGETSATPAGGNTVTVIEANIDDMSPQLAGAALDALLKAGAKDAWLTPIYMKKNRPGVTLSALTDATDRDAVIQTLLRETTTIGLRSWEVERTCLPRRIETVSTPFGSVRVKVSGALSHWPTATPEYDDCLALAHTNGVPTRIIQQAAIAAAVEAGLTRRAEDET